MSEYFLSVALSVGEQLRKNQIATNSSNLLKKVCQNIFNHFYSYGQYKHTKVGGFIHYMASIVFLRKQDG